MENKIPILALLFASSIWAATALSYKFFLAAGISLAIIFVVTRLFKMLSVLAIARYKNVHKLNLSDKKEFFFLILNAIFSLGTPVLFVLALANTSLTNVYFIHYTMPAWVFIMAALFLGENITAKKSIAVAGTIIGILLISNPQEIFSVNLGILFAFLSAISFAGDIITARELRDYSYHAVSIYSNALQLILFTVTSLIIFNNQSAIVSLVDIGFLSAIGVFLGIASYLYYYSLQKIDASTAGVISLSELLFTFVLGFFVLGEIPKGFELLGYILISFSALALFLRKADIESFENLILMRKKH